MGGSLRLWTRGVRATRSRRPPILGHDDYASVLHHHKAALRELQGLPPEEDETTRFRRLQRTLREIMAHPPRPASA